MYIILSWYFFGTIPKISVTRFMCGSKTSTPLPFFMSWMIIDFSTVVFPDFISPPRNMFCLSLSSIASGTVFPPFEIYPNTVKSDFLSDVVVSFLVSFFFLKNPKSIRYYNCTLKGQKNTGLVGWA